MTATISRDELARRVRLRGFRIGRGTSQMFLAFWIAEGLVREVTTGEYVLTDEGLRVAGGLLDVDRDERTP